MGNRIGVITYWRIYNIGSYLQAFALQQVLKRAGFNPCVIVVQDNSKLDRLKSKSKLLFKLLCHPLYLPSFLELRKMGRQTISDISSTAKLKFDKDEKLVDVVTTNSKHLRMIAKSDDYVAFICGSDQIWNPLGFELRDYKYLKFAPSNKRIAYAPSFGINYVPSYNIKQVTKGLKGMKSISVREMQGAQIIEQLIQLKVPVVLDPTFLLSKEEWQKWELAIDIPEEYVVCFFLSEPSKETLIEVERLGEGKSIVCFPKSYGLENNKNVICLPVGPLEFLYVIDHASVVCTDSFHGVALSTVYEKPVVVFRRTHKSEYNQFSRIENILRLTNNTASIFGEDGYIGPSVPDITKVEFEKEKSINYLIKAIKDE